MRKGLLCSIIIVTLMTLGLLPLKSAVATGNGFTCEGKYCDFRIYDTEGETSFIFGPIAFKQTYYNYLRGKGYKNTHFAFYSVSSDKPIYTYVVKEHGPFCFDLSMLRTGVYYLEITIDPHEERSQLGLGIEGIIKRSN